MKHKEIGSEFWFEKLSVRNCNNLEFLNIGNDNKLVFSGRTAIDFVINDIKNSEKIVYMPDYCCMSMVKPLLDNGYKVKYYKCDIKNNKYEINLDEKCSIFFAMSYFGYSMTNMDYYISEFHKKGVIIVEDITHRFLCKKNYCENSDYIVCSLRKWFPIISGGLAIKINGNFKNKIDNYRVDNDFIEDKKIAMKLKSDYINNLANEKEQYLELFNKTNKQFENYKNMAIDEISPKILKKIDLEKIKFQRYENAKLIEKKLKYNSNVRLMYSLSKGDVPLFVPVILKNRNDIKGKLNKNKIYCSAHWPNEIESKNEIYNEELSLICDQRYTKDNIEEYINKFIEIVGKISEI